jgi:hypothetical protein
LQKCLIYILNKFTPTILLPYTPLLRVVSTCLFFIFIHEYIVHKKALLINLYREFHYGFPMYIHKYILHPDMVNPLHFSLFFYSPLLMVISTCLKTLSSFFCFPFIIIFLFTCVYIIWVISPPCSPPPFPPQFQAVHVLPLSLVLLKKRDKPNKEDKVFLLVDLMIAIQKYS